MNHGEMTMAAVSQGLVRTPTTVEFARIKAECERAIRRLDRVIGEREDVLLVHAREAVEHAAAMSDRQLRSGEGV